MNAQEDTVIDTDQARRMQKIVKGLADGTAEALLGLLDDLGYTAAEVRRISETSGPDNAAKATPGFVATLLPNADGDPVSGVGASVADALRRAVCRASRESSATTTAGVERGVE